MPASPARNPLGGTFVAGTDSRLFDLTGDHLVNLADRDVWLEVAGAANLASGNPYLLGDANLDGVVDGSDFGLWNANKFTSTAAWCAGDFNADGVADGSDFGIWNANKFTSSDGTSLIPEPSCWLLIVAACLKVLGERRSDARIAVSRGRETATRRHPACACVPARYGD